MPINLAILGAAVKTNNSVINAYSDTCENANFINIIAHRVSLAGLATFFKLSSVHNCDSAVDAFAVDTVENEYRFTVVYVLQSSLLNYNLRIITKTKDGLALLSLQDIYPAFNWAEREIWDLFGIFFTKHPDLRRILTDYGFSGHPLRKDFPISGFREIRYSDLTKQIVYGNIELTQNYRLTSLCVPKSDNA